MTEYVPEVVTVMARVVAPFDQRFPVKADEVKVTLPPWQKVNGLFAEIVGAVAGAVIVIVVGADCCELQLPLSTTTK